MFSDRPDVLKVIGSALYAREKRWKQVDGPYTQKGHLAVIENIARAARILESEQWVVPLGADESVDSIPKHLDTLVDDYEQSYIQQWTDWMADVTVRPPANLKEAKALYTELTKPEYPYLRILRALDRHTQWKRDGYEINVNYDFNMMILGRVRRSAVPGEFKRTVQFGVPDVPDTAAPVTKTDLERYISVLQGVRDKIQQLEDANPNANAEMMKDDLIFTIRLVDGFLVPSDDRAKVLLRPLLLNPLLIVSARLPPLTSIRRLPASW